MKILYLLNTTSMTGGSTKSFLHLLDKVKERHEVTVVCPDDRGLAAWLRESGVDVRVIRYEFNVRPAFVTRRDKLFFIPRYIRRRVGNMRARRLLRRIVEECRPDIIHTNSSVNEIGYEVARAMGIPHVMHVREYGDKDHGLHIYGIRRRLRGPGYTICITRDIARHRRLLDRPTNRVIYNPIVADDGLRPILPKEHYILYAARLDRTKGLGDLVEAYIRYCEGRENPMKLVVAGNHTTERQTLFKRELEARLESAGLSGNVSWLGEVDDVESLMSGARATVVASRFEGFGRVMPEAIAAGSLVIGRDTGGTHEQFENGLACTGREIGLRFTTVEQLASALAKAGEMTEEEMRGYVEAGQEVVSKLYTDSASAGGVLRLYDDISSFQ